MPNQTTTTDERAIPVFPEQAAALNPKSVTVYDDDADTANAIIDALKQAGYDACAHEGFDGHCQSCDTSAETAAIVAIRDDEPRAMECVAALWNARVPVVAAIAPGRPELLHRAKAAGALAAISTDAPAAAFTQAADAAFSAGFAVRTLEHRVHQLERNLVHRRLVEQAKWKLVTNQGMTEPEAHTALQRYARNHRTALPEVAEGVINGDIALSVSDA